MKVKIYAEDLLNRTKRHLTTIKNSRLCVGSVKRDLLKECNTNELLTVYDENKKFLYFIK